MAPDDEALFPAFEEATGMVAGPTRVMRAEHAEMRRLLSEVLYPMADRSLRNASEVVDRMRSVVQG